MHLTQLALTEKIDLGRHDKSRLDTDMLFELFVQGYTHLEDDEMDRFAARHWDQMKRLEAPRDDRLVPV